MRGWEIRDDCSVCGQNGVLGLGLQDEVSLQSVFWCCACIDEHSDRVVPAPTPAEELTDDEDIAKPTPIKRKLSQCGEESASKHMRRTKSGNFVEAGQTIGCH